MTILDRLLGRQPARKATTGGPWLTAYQSGGINLSAWGNTYQERAVKYLAAYGVGWFYKGGSRISRDMANLVYSLAYEDTEGNNEDDIVTAANNVPFERLTPTEQFLRLWEHPNPYQTGRSLKQRTQIRLDFAGRAFLFLEGGDGGDLPTALYGISPTRMWESRDETGRLIGWVMDKDRMDGGVPFSTDEIIVLEYPGPDDEEPIGVVRSVYANVPLTEQMARHTSDVLTTGGRLAGMAWPKDRALDEAEYQDAQRAWRNVASDPNAARRLLLFPEPMEYSAGASSPAELGIPELAKLSREEILTAFPVHPFMVGVPLETGMNSGESLRWVKEEYWEGTIHPRAEVWEDAVQQQMVPRYESAMGRPLDFDIEEPNLDDAPAIVEKVGAFRGLVSIGFDPKEAVAAVALDHIKWNGLPALLDPAKQAEAAAAKPTEPTESTTVTVGDRDRQDPSSVQQTVIGKAQMVREDVTDREFPGLHAAVQEVLDDQRRRVIAAIEASPPTKAERMKGLPEWWDAAAEDALFLDRLRSIYLSLGRNALVVVASNTDRIIPGKSVDRILEGVLARSGVRITDINETTRRTIADTLAEGVRRGYSITQLVNGVADEAYGGVQGALTANGVNVWDAYRAEVIARTETMNAYNQAALLGYKDIRVREVQAIDGDKDEECADRDGKVFAVDDALDISDHPNGTLDWAPLS